MSSEEPSTMKPELITDQALLAGIKQHERAALNILYTFYYPTVERFILRNNGSRADAEDVFQEVLIALLKKIPTEDFTLTSSLKTYIFAVASNIWLKRLRRAKRTVQADFTDFDEALTAHDHDTTYTLELETDDEEQTLKLRIQRSLEKITEHCQRLIRAIFFQNKKASELGYKNAHTAQNQQYKCMEQLRKANDTPNA